MVKQVLQARRSNFAIWEVLHFSLKISVCMVCFIDEKKIFASICPEVSKALATSKYFVLL